LYAKIRLTNFAYASPLNNFNIKIEHHSVTSLIKLANKKVWGITRQRRTRLEPRKDLGYG